LASTCGLTRLSETEDHSIHKTENNKVLKKLIPLNPNNLNDATKRIIIMKKDGNPNP